MVPKKTIDYVFPYVDCDDPKWIEEYNKYVPKEKEKQNTWSTGMQRFRSNDLLKYVFRSIEKNMPFIRKIHFIVMSESQVPEWIDREKIHVVLHKDFIPEEFLPTFNSNTIESFLGNIPGLSERFIYGNDDLFITSLCKESDFFEMNVPKYTVKRRKIMPHAPGDQLRKDDLELITGKKSKKVLEVQHICMPYCLSSVKEVFDLHKGKILSSIGKFRSDGQYNQWIYSIYHFMKKKQINSGIKYLSTEITPNKRHVYNCNWLKYKAVCLNDSSETTQTDLQIVKRKLDRLFPRRSKYEAQDKKEEKKKEKEVMNQVKKRVMKPKPQKERPESKTWNTFFELQ